MRATCTRWSWYVGRGGRKDWVGEHGFRQRGVDAGGSIREPQKSGTLCFDHQFARHDGVAKRERLHRGLDRHGRGLVDWKQYFAHFAKVCPDAPVCIETISGFNRELP